MSVLSGWTLYSLIILSFMDTVLTYEWAKLCFKLKPGLKVKQVESNPFVCVCWNNFGFVCGSLVSGIVLLFMQLMLSSIHKYMFYIIIGILIFAVLNHINNFIKVKQGKVFKDYKNDDKEVKK